MGGARLDGNEVAQYDAARRLNVSHSVVRRLWNQYQTEASVSRRHVPGRSRATKPAEDRFIGLSADHSVESGRRISASTARMHLHNLGLYARRPVVCVPLNRRLRRARLSWAREHVS
ncbi:HTH_Tnp_Tc3_2 domain-containing protein [Trichonephila clavipes]|nr:HTH_Tnp_Tc3_2 domain-containing protein [Trichonephila clavipes]